MSVPRPVDAVGFHQFGAEVVLQHGDDLHLLDPVAGIVWQCLDGEATAAEIAEDLAPVFGGEVARVRADVDAAIDSFAAAGLLEAPDAPAAPVPFLDPDGTLFCETCVQAPDRAERTVLRVADHLVVIGTDTPAVRDAVEAACASLVVASADLPPSTPSVPPTFSITLADRAPRGLRPLHALHGGSPVALSSRRARRVLEALPLHLAVHGDLAAAGVVAIPAVAVAAVGTEPGDPVVLVPHSPRAAQRDRRSARRGLTRADTPVVLLDPLTGEVVVGAPGLDVDLGPLHALADSVADLGDEPAPLAWGRYPVAAIGARGLTDPARALLALGPSNEGWPTLEASLEALAALVTRVELLEGDGLR
ncbi:MAG: PqqD family protein [Actinomycetes bacterium]